MEESPAVNDLLVGNYSSDNSAWFERLEPGRTRNYIKL